MDHVANYNLSLNHWRVTPEEAPIWYPGKIVIETMDEDGYFYTAQGGDYERYLGQIERMRVARGGVIKSSLPPENASYTVTRFRPVQ